MIMTDHLISKRSVLITGNNVLSNNCSETVDHQFMFIEVGFVFVNPIHTVINQSTNVYVYMCV